MRRPYGQRVDNPVALLLPTRWYLALWGELERQQLSVAVQAPRPAAVSLEEPYDPARDSRRERPVLFREVTWTIADAFM